MHFSVPYTQAAEIAASMVNKSDRTVRQWQTDLINNDVVIPETKQGRYVRSEVLWDSEEMNKKAFEYVCANQCVKGQPNLTTISFCKWINKRLLPSSTLEPEYPRCISVETARKWLHQLGFAIVTPRKGIFIDGHERQDVVEYRALFLGRMIKIGFIHSTNSPTDTSRNAIQTAEQNYCIFS